MPNCFLLQRRRVRPLLPCPELFPGPAGGCAPNPYRGPGAEPLIRGQGAKPIPLKLKAF